VEVRTIVEEAFNAQWSRSGGARLSQREINLIAGAFDLQNVRRDILLEMAKISSVEEARRRRIHRTRLQGLAPLFAIHLINEVEKGQSREEAIIEAMQLGLSPGWAWTIANGEILVLD
jgi:hypothetical protein